jgi:hypothetical protein
MLSASSVTPTYSADRLTPLTQKHMDSKIKTTLMIVIALIGMTLFRALPHECEPAAISTVMEPGECR